jgi:hypothetical protein
MVFADFALPRSPAFDNCVMKPVAIFNSANDRVGGGTLDGIEDEDQAVTHLKMATKRPMDCEDTKGEHLTSSLIEQLPTGEYVTKWVVEPTTKKTDVRTGYGGSVDQEPGAKPRSRNKASDKRSNLDLVEFRTTWGQVSGRFDVEESEPSEGVIKYDITIGHGKATVILDTKARTATLSNQTLSENSLYGVQAAFEAAATAGGKKK